MEIINLLFLIKIIIELSIITSESDSEILENFLIEVSVSLREQIKEQMHRSEATKKLLNKCSELCNLIKNENTKILVIEDVNIVSK